MLALRTRALKVLRGDLTSRADAALRVGAVQAMGFSQEPSLRESLEAVLGEKDASPDLKAQAAITLGLLGDRKSAAALRKAFGESSDVSV